MLLVSYILWVGALENPVSTSEPRIQYQLLEYPEGMRVHMLLDHHHRREHHWYQYLSRCFCAATTGQSSEVTREQLNA